MKKTQSKQWVGIFQKKFVRPEINGSIVAFFEWRPLLSAVAQIVEKLIMETNTQRNAYSGGWRPGQQGTVEGGARVTYMWFNSLGNGLHCASVW